MSDNAWQPIETAPATPVAVAMYFPGRSWRLSDGSPAALPPERDFAERVEVGFWDGLQWREAGTGHEVFEGWRIENNDTPTHWMPLPPPPAPTR